jgi:hypothetical protein
MASAVRTGSHGKLPRMMKLVVHLSFVFLVTCACYSHADVLVVRNSAAGPSSAPLSRTALQAIFGMRFQQWENGLPVRVFVLPDDHPSHVAFCKQVLRVFPHQLRSAWDRLVFSGIGQAPIELKSEDDMRARILETPGAIGYLPSNMVSDNAILALPID